MHDTSTISPSNTNPVGRLRLSCSHPNQTLSHLGASMQYHMNHSRKGTTLPAGGPRRPPAGAVRKRVAIMPHTPSLRPNNISSLFVAIMMLASISARTSEAFLFPAACPACRTVSPCTGTLLGKVRCKHVRNLWFESPNRVLLCKQRPVAVYQ